MIEEYSAELALIGAMLIDEDFAPVALEKVRLSDLTSVYAREVWRIALELSEQGRPIDPVLIAEESDDRDVLGKWMVSAMEATTTTANGDEYISIVKRNSRLRRIHAIGDQLSVAGVDFRESAVKSIEDIEQVVDETADTSVTGADEWATTFAKEQDEIIANPESAYCRTGFDDLDRILGGGMFNGGLYVLAARPGMGKTTFALNIAERVAKRKQSVLLISLEMDSREIMCKRIAAEQDIPYKALMSGHITEPQRVAMAEGIEILRHRPFFTNRAAALTISDISALAKSVKGCGLVVIDYFGLISVEGQEHDRYNDYTNISGKLKRMARRLKTPVLCLAQLNRNTESRTNKKPMLADLRDTGALEQDADGVIFLHRESYYKDGAKPDVDDIDVIVAKNRHGETGSSTMWWKGSCGQIAEMSRTEDYL